MPRVGSLTYQETWICATQLDRSDEVATPMPSTASSIDGTATSAADLSDISTTRTAPRVARRTRCLEVAVRRAASERGACWPCGSVVAHPLDEWDRRCAAAVARPGDTRHPPRADRRPRSRRPRLCCRQEVGTPSDANPHQPRRRSTPSGNHSDPRSFRSPVTESRRVHLARRALRLEARYGPGQRRARINPTGPDAQPWSAATADARVRALRGRHRVRQRLPPT